MYNILVRFYSGEFIKNINIDNLKWYKARTDIIADSIILTIQISNTETEVLVYDSLDELLQQWDIRYIRSEDI